MKKLMLFIFVLATMFACNKEDISLDRLTDDVVTPRGNKVNVCHQSGNSGNWQVINISVNALQAHLNHGDVLLEDADGDGFVEAENECVPGGDCNDQDATIFPGAEEICGDDIDNNCDGEADEDCVACPDCEFSDILNAIDLSAACVVDLGGLIVIYTFGQNANQCCGLAVFSDGSWTTGADFGGVSGNSSPDCYACFNQYIQDSGISTCNFLRDNSTVDKDAIFSTASTDMDQ